MANWTINLQLFCNIGIFERCFSSPKGIENIAAYCLYSNLGFKMDPTLVDCYGTPGTDKLMKNLYMIQILRI